MPDGDELPVFAALAEGQLTHEDAFVSLYRAYGQITRAWFAQRAPAADVDDLLQDVWSIFWGRWREWVPSEATATSDPRPVLTFLSRTCHLTLMAHRRLTGDGATRAIEATDPLVASPRAATRDLESGELDDVIRAATQEVASRRAAIVELEDVRLSVNTLCARLESSGGADELATSRWTVRQVIAHLASWATRTRIELESLAEGKNFPESIHFEREGGPREWNQRAVDDRDRRTLASLVEEFDVETARTADIVARIPNEELQQVAVLPRTSGARAVAWRMPLASLVIGTCWHVRYHLTRVDRVFLAENRRLGRPSKPRAQTT